MKEVLWICVGSPLSVAIFMGFMCGAHTAYYEGRCKYPSLMSYWPTRIIACELWEQRWENH